MHAARLTRRSPLKVVLAGVLLLAATLIVVLVAMVATGKPAEAAPTGAHKSESQVRAYGHGDYRDAPGYSFDFSAHGGLLSGNAQGFFSQSLDGVVHVRAEVSCMTVEDNIVTMGGYITEPGFFPEGEWVIFTVQDNGPSGEDDIISSVHGDDISPPGECSPVPLYWAVSNGDVVVETCAKFKEKKGKCKPPKTENRTTATERLGPVFRANPGIKSPITPPE